MTGKFRLTLKYSLIAILLLTAGMSTAQSAVNHSPKIATISDTAYTYKAIQANGNTWGYDIFKSGKRIIHQPAMPGISGNEGFKSQTDAEKVAKLVITKLKNGEMPPSVSKEELINLKVLK